MPQKSSAKQEPEKQNPANTSDSLPEPSPDFESVDGNTWGKENNPTPESPPDSHKPALNNEQSYLSKQVKSNNETTWAALAHLSVLLNLVTGFLGGIVAIIIYFVYKDRSRFVAYHAMQSFIFQTIAWLGGGLISGILIAFGGAFSFLILPLLCLIPGILILLLIPISLIYGVIGAVQVSNGGDFRYWLVGDWVCNIRKPQSK